MVTPPAVAIHTVPSPRTTAVGPELPLACELAMPSISLKLVSTTRGCRPSATRSRLARSVYSTPRLLVIHRWPAWSGRSSNTVSTGMPCSRPTRASLPPRTRYRPRSVVIHTASPRRMKPNTVRAPPRPSSGRGCTWVPRSTSAPSRVPIQTAPGSL